MTIMIEGSQEDRDLKSSTVANKETPKPGAAIISKKGISSLKTSTLFKTLAPC